MVIDDNKFAAFVQYFGRKVEEPTGDYILEVPFSEAVKMPRMKQPKVIPADNASQRPSYAYVLYDGTSENTTSFGIEPE